MFYSQFILAKKGPLGTIWIAAHLERKLRKNQVADTDIGVSVDSILFPDVPIALRLSSHLLLGVVRIYSRKVNYLFDDCSEALLKIKQAFRSTAVDLPPEESTAPYHSITLPETFDLDDFELPDNEIFQGNYVDHHISTKEQITLQDTMEGVVYSTSQFGLDERFGDGDASQIGLDLDEDLFLNKVEAPEPAGVLLDPNFSADPQASMQEVVGKEDENDEPLDGTSQAMPPDTNDNKDEDQPASTEFVDYAQAPSTPGLVKEPNLSNVQKALASDDHMESEDHNATELEVIENTGNAASSLDQCGDKNMLDQSLLDTMDPGSIRVKENGYGKGEPENEQLKLHNNNTAKMFVQVTSGSISDAPEDLSNLKNLENGAPDNNRQNSGYQVEGIGLDGTVASPDLLPKPSCSDAEDVLEKSCLDSTCMLGSEGLLENDRAALKPQISNVVVTPVNAEESCSVGDAFTLNAVRPLEAPKPVNFEGQACHDPNDLNIRSPVEEMTSTSIHVLQACSSKLDQHDKLSLEGGNSLDVLSLPSAGFCSIDTSEREKEIHASGGSSEMQGEESQPTGTVKPVFELKQMWADSCKNNEADSSKLDLEAKNVISEDNIESSTPATFELPAPEKLLSVLENTSDLPKDLLVDATPDNQIQAEGEGDGTGVGTITGKKRSFTESTITMESLNSEESFGKGRPKRTAESIPDDDDLLSSILVGRRSSILKLKPTPPQAETAPMKRPRTAPRASASKRKVPVDEMMVLHGDTIRQQLINTQDIRRVRKKAPCTPHEVWMIQKQFLEEEIFNEPIFSGMSVELICLHNQTFDLSKIIVSKVDKSVTSPELAPDIEPSERQNVDIDAEKQGNTEPLVIANDEEEQPSEMEIIRESITGTDAVDNADALVVESSFPSTSDVGSPKSLPPGSVDELQMDASCPLPNQMLDSPAKSYVSNMHLSSEPIVNLAVLDDQNPQLKERDESLLEENGFSAFGDILAGVKTDSLAPTDIVEPSATRLRETGGINEPGVLASAMGYGGNETYPSSNSVCVESETGLSCPLEPDVIDKHGSSDCEQNELLNDCEEPRLHESAEAQATMDVETSELDHPAVECTVDMENKMVEHDTEFLNVDDELDEEDDNSMPSAEETRILDNSGWSSRTRAVARYLQIIFDKEAENGKKVVPMNNLLTGKTRKEASRMFFETLVLKTRDYIHVEQGSPFDNISIKPQSRLMKSDF